MAVVILTGSLSATDISLGGASVKCGFARIACQFTRGSTSSTTFCTSGWVSEIPGMRQAAGSIVGYAVKGVAWADPLVWVTASAPIAAVLTADTGCHIDMNINVFSDGIDLVAAANSSRGVDFRSDGAVTSTWVIA
jgi:hypothetical protein